MSQERIGILESIGFIWDQQAAVWQQRFRELKSFKKDYGHCIVPRDFQENPNLSTWTQCQRSQYKLHEKGLSSSISKKRIQQLTSLGFQWNTKEPKCISQICKSAVQSSDPSFDTACIRGYSDQFDHGGVEELITDDKFDAEMENELRLLFPSVRCLADDDKGSLWLPMSHVPNPGPGSQRESNQCSNQCSSIRPSSCSLGFCPNLVFPDVRSITSSKRCCPVINGWCSCCFLLKTTFVG